MKHLITYLSTTAFLLIAGFAQVWGISCQSSAYIKLSSANCVGGTGYNNYFDVGPVRFGYGASAYDYTGSGNPYDAPWVSDSDGLWMYSGGSSTNSNCGTIYYFWVDTDHTNYRQYGYSIVAFGYDISISGPYANLRDYYYSPSYNTVHNVDANGTNNGLKGHYEINYAVNDYNIPRYGIKVRRMSGQAWNAIAIGGEYVYYNCPDPAFSENSTVAHITSDINGNSILHQDGANVDLYVNLTHSAGKYQLFCPPTQGFALSHFGDGAEAYTFASVSGQRIVLNKVTATTLNRNTVYLIKPTTNYNDRYNTYYLPMFTADYEPSQGANSYTLKGTYCKKDLSSLSNVFYFKNDMADARNIKGMRGYFTFPAGVANARDIPWVVEDAMGNTTAIKGIDEIREQLVVKSSPYANNIYDINGQQQSSNLQQLRRGIYIRNGKKFFKQ